VLGAYRETQALSDVSNRWDFSSASQYVYGSGTEVVGNSARLKAQNYAADGNTRALYHLDESSGTNVNDSSGNTNDGIASNATFGTGSLNNSLSFNGTNSRVSVPDSTSLSLSQANTLEGWTKFDNTFSASSTSQRQTIFDKGEYQLYYDNETGKLTYELADASASSWSQVAGTDLNKAWSLNKRYSVNAIIGMGSHQYVGVGSVAGEAEVWDWDGSSWTLIGGGPDSVHNSWSAQTYEGVLSLATDGTNIYAGLGSTPAGDGEVWKWNGLTWSKIGGDSANSGWTNYSEAVLTLDYFGGNLYAGIGSSANDAEVWKWNGLTWSKIGGDSANSGWTTNYEVVGALTDDGTSLYAGLGTTAGDAEVWKWNGSTWLQIGGDSVNSSWDTTIETVRSLRYFGGKLYAGLGDSAGDADVWMWNGSTWSQIGGDGANSSWAAATYEQVTSFTYDGTNLYAGLGTGNGDGEVWMWNGSTWSQIGGDGTNNSWITSWGDSVNTLFWDGTKLFAGTYDSAGIGWVHTWNGSSWAMIGGNNVNESWGYYGLAAVQVMQTVGDYLYAGLGNVAGSAEVWKWNGSSWAMIGGQGINNSWAPNTYEQVMSMASYGGHLFVGLGTTASATENDAEVWEWNGSVWSQVGGDGAKSSWTFTASHYGEVESMAADDNFLYAGLGLGSNDGEVWRYDGDNWEKIGGDSLHSGWTNYIENVYSLALYNGKLIAGLGRSTGDGEIWQWDGSMWSKIGGDAAGGSWGATAYQSIESLVTYGSDLYAGLGNVTGSATLWKYDGSVWTEVGGDDINGSWTTGTYEKIKTLVVFDGALFVGLGNSTGDGEVWRLSDGAWAKIAGSGVNLGWSGAVEEVESFSPYKGKLYAGTGFSSNYDATVWTWGNNAFLQSSTSSLDADWHHVAATYDGTTMKLFIDGALDASTTANITLPNSARPLLIGTSYAGREYGKAQGYFAGQLDELRISDIARSSFNAAPYATTPQTVTLSDAIHTSGIWHWDGFADDETTNGGSILFRLSADGGASWLYWDGSSWVVSSELSNANDTATINAHMDVFPVTFYGLKWQAILQGDGSQRVMLNSVSTVATSDLQTPSDGAGGAITAEKVHDGAVLASQSWTNGASPYFTWPAATDGESGIKGYCLYLGNDDSADPVTTAGLLGSSPIYSANHCQFMVNTNSVDLGTAGYVTSPITSSDEDYYLIVKSIDMAGNVSAVDTQFLFKFDNTLPSNPSFITAPSGFVNDKAVTLAWPVNGTGIPDDAHSGFTGLQYRIGSSGTWYGDNHSGTGDSSDLLVNDGSYTMQDSLDYDNLQDGINTIYFRAWDEAGNVTTSYATAIVKINTSGAPSEPQELQANPTINTTNTFSFSWSAPATYIGGVGNLTYCYTVNVLPHEAGCTYTPAGVTSLGSGAYATRPGTNTLYVVAKDESGNINYDSVSSINFSANTPSPGMPLNADIVDVSIKATSNWRLAITWDEPADSGAEISTYRVYRSTNNVDFSPIGSSSSTTYIDAGLTQQTYYYEVGACDSTNNCGAMSSVVHELPTGKFTSPATLASEPAASSITTRKAAISWSTDRASDSKVALGTTSGKYSSSEIASSDQTSAHHIDIDNLSAGTTYYYVAKWTDEDGNTGISQEYQFATSPAPSFKDITMLSVGLSTVTIQFTTANASKVALYYGPTTAFGGVQTINTATSESTYNMQITGLNDGTKYVYKLVSYDSEGNAYTGDTYSFSTPPAPRISNLRFQPVAGEPTSTQQISWMTNVPSTSSIVYGVVGTNGTDLASAELTVDHSITVSDLVDDSQYFLYAQSRDKDGNLAVSDKQSFHTALDTRSPRVNNITVESSIRGTGADARGQVIVSWTTDEPATSQVAYGEGSSATEFNNKTAEDSGLSFEHIVIVSDLPTSKVYSVQPVSYDKARNAAFGKAQPAIIGHASDNVMTIVINALQRIFGF